MLMLQKSHAEGLRALLYVRSNGSRISESGSSPTTHSWAKREDFLLPLVKGYSSEKAYELLATSLQVFGGSGFTQDYPIEQYIRDAKIDTLYEGTTAIQALDLFFRKIVRDQGQTLMRFAEGILEYVKGGSDEFATERQALGQALEQVQNHVGVLVNHSMASMQEPTELYKVGFHTNALLESLAEVIMAWLLLEHAEIAAAKLPEATGDDVAFYQGKIASARFFVKDALPKAALRTAAAQEEDGWLMELPLEAF